jgi:hypothetical protein
MTLTCGLSAFHPTFDDRALQHVAEGKDLCLDLLILPLMALQRLLLWGSSSSHLSLP